MSSVDSVKSLTLELPPSCVEFWPADEQYAVVGTYNLETQSPGGEAPQPTSQRRNGSLILLHVEHDNVKIIQTFSTPSAILDIHFGPEDIPPKVFGVATSTGSVGVYELKDGHGVQSSRPPSVHPVIEHVKTVQYFPEDVLVTAFLWHPKGWSIGMTLSSGQVCLGKFELRETTDSNASIDVATHDLEAWTLAFTSDGSGLYSGGDDSVLQFVEVATNQKHHGDFEVEPEHEAFRRMPWADRRIHGAGVTAILPLWSEDGSSLVLTGSYDDHIRLVQINATGRRSVLVELNLGGGVWRLKRLSPLLSSGEQALADKKEAILLASCMHAGARIVRLRRGDAEQWRFEVLAQFEEHKSMNYGSDCQNSFNDKGQHTFITTSFYDRRLCLWRF